MAMYSWAAPPKLKSYKRVYEGRDRRPYARTADHIRGRVYRMHKNSVGDWMWGMQVVNTRTGQVIASDDCSIYQAVVDLCDEATAVARGTWFWGLTQKQVK